MICFLFVSIGLIGRCVQSSFRLSYIKCRIRKCVLRLTVFFFPTILALYTLMCTPWRTAEVRAITGDQGGRREGRDHDARVAPRRAVTIIVLPVRELRVISSINRRVALRRNLERNSKWRRSGPYAIAVGR